MPKFVIERDIPEAGKLTDDQLQGVAKKSCGVLRKLGTESEYLHPWFATPRQAFDSRRLLQAAAGHHGYRAQRAT